MANPLRVEVKSEPKSRAQTDQQKNESVKNNHDSHQPGNTEKTEAAFEFVEQRHLWPTVAQQFLTSILSLSERERRTTHTHPRKMLRQGTSPLLLGRGERIKVRSRNPAQSMIMRTLAPRLSESRLGA